MSLADREHLPKVVTDVDGIRDILLALDPEIVLLREDISQLIKELYIATTEKYIDRWEQDFSLPYDGSLTLEQRRQRVKNKLARKKTLNWQNLRLLIKNNIVKPRFYIVNEAENYHFKIFLEQQPQRQEFDLSKFTVVGSPTITDDGVASGFGTRNYLTSSNSVTINPNNFRLHFEFTTGSDITTPQMIIRSNDGQNAFIIGLRNGKIKLYLQSATTTGSWDITSDILSSNLLTTNTKYNGYLSFNGSVYTLNINGSNWITVKSSALIRSSFVLKIGQGMATEPFLGSINLPSISITADGKEVFSGVKNIDYITNELRTSLNQAKPAYLTYDIIVTEFFTRYCGTFSSGTEPL